MELNDRLEVAEEEKSDNQKRRREDTAQIRQEKDSTQCLARLVLNQDVHLWVSLR